LKRTARISGPDALLLGLLLSACASTSNQPAPTQDVPQHLVQLMHESAEAWNRGDLDGFLVTYANDSQTTFMGNPPTLGLDSIRTRYQRTYFRDGRPRDQLAFDELVTRMLGPNHALMRGRCILTNPADNSRTYCRYSLVWERRPEGWRIIHDHSS
jgi:uncharacterized protein (TIGR02246 family)